MLRSWSRCLAAAICVLLAPLATPGEQKGVLWETTSETVMEGMPMKMPVQTVRVCAAQEWDRPPDSGDQTCTTTNFRRVGAKATWTVQCKGEMPMTGTGEMTYGPDSYSGTITLTSGPMRMKVKLSGRKVGVCDRPG